MRILLATPTRGRPESFSAMVHTARATASNNEHLAIVARVDRDDPQRGGYFWERGYSVIQGKRERLPVLWNEIVSEYRYDIVMMAADDIRFRTTGWDDEVRFAFKQWPDGIGLAYPDDGIHGQRLATHSFVSRQFVDTVGFYLPATLTGDFVDNWLHTLARVVGREAYLPRVYIEHLHPIVGKAQMDDTYNYRLTGNGPAKAQKAWKEVIESGLPIRAIEKLKGAISAAS